MFLTAIQGYYMGLQKTLPYQEYVLCISDFRESMNLGHRDDLVQYQTFNVQTYFCEEALNKKLRILTPNL